MNRFRVLLIDDDEDDHLIIRDLLEEIRSYNFELDWRSSYGEGLAALRQGGYDVCLLDYRLGEKTGLDLLREFREESFSTPVILLTGQSDFDLDMQAMRIGAAEYLVKGQLTAGLLERSIRYSIKHALDKNELRAQRELFEVLFNSTFEAIFVHAPGGRIQDTNRAATEIFGFSRDEIRGKNLLDLIRNDQQTAFSRHLESRTSETFESFGLHKDGHAIPIEVVGRSVRVQGQETFLAAIRDLTERKEMETQILQQDRLASLGLLASSLAHEIGTPLGIIRSRTELIAKKAGEGTDMKSDMHMIIGQIDRIAKLVHSLLHLARGKNAQFGSAVSLRPVIEDMLHLIRHEFDRKGIELSFQFPAEEIFVKAEAGPLGQVFLNLLVNSVHAIEEARKTRPRSQDRIDFIVKDVSTKIEIQIKDSGQGITEENLQQLFKPFFTTKEIGVGTGLGLATSYKLLQSWGGEIKAESSFGDGAVFTISLNKTSP